MVKLIREGAYYLDGRIMNGSQSHITLDRKALAAKSTIAYGVLAAHNEATRLDPALRFDVVVTEPACFSDVIRAAEIVKLGEFPVPCILADEKGEMSALGVSAAKRYGGTYVPQGTFSATEYVRSSVVMANDLILSSCPISVGALGAMAMCGSAGDILDVLLSERIEAERPEVVCVYLKGKLRAGVGPLDVALAVQRASDGACSFIKGRILEFIGAGIARLSQEMRNAIDACFADMGCLATVWETDAKTEEYFRTMGRQDAFFRLAPKQPAYYDGAILVDLGGIEPMAEIGGAVFSVRELLDEPEETLGKAEQAARRRGLTCDFRSLISGKDIPVAGALFTRQNDYDTLARTAEFLRGKKACPVAAVPASEPVERALERGDYLGAFTKERLPEGLIVGDGLLRMDACSAAASAVEGKVTSAAGLDCPRRVRKYRHTARQTVRKIQDFSGAPKKVKLDWGDLPMTPRLTPLPNALLLKAVPAGEGDFSEASEILSKHGLPIDTVCGKLAVYRDLPVYEDDFRAALALRSRGVLAVLAKEYGNMLSACTDWGMVPFVSVKAEQIADGYLYVKGLRAHVEKGEPIEAAFLGEDKKMTLEFPVMPEVVRAWLILGGRLRARGGEK